MVAYSFQPQYRAPILAGSKRFTFRMTGKKRHARIGEALQLRDGRTGPVFATAECCYRARVIIAERGLVRVLAPSFTEPGSGLFSLFRACEQGMPQADAHLAKLAAADGFDSWADLVGWHAEVAAPDENGAMAREVIGFSGVVARA